MHDVSDHIFEGKVHLASQLLVGCPKRLRSHWYHLWLPNLSVWVSTVFVAGIFFSLVRILLSDILSRYYSLWTSYMNVTIPWNMTEWLRMRKQSIPDHFSPPTRPWVPSVKCNYEILYAVGPCPMWQKLLFMTRPSCFLEGSGEKIKDKLGESERGEGRSGREGGQKRRETKSKGRELERR